MAGVLIRNFYINAASILGLKRDDSHLESAAVWSALNKNRFLFNWEMDLGKSYATAALFVHLSFAIGENFDWQRELDNSPSSSRWLSAASAAESLTGGFNQLRTVYPSSMGTETRALIEWDSLSREIGEATTIQDLNALRSKVETIRVLSKQSKRGLETQNRIAEFRLRVDRKRGTWIAENIEVGGEGSNQHAKKELRSGRTTLAQIGISKSESSILQRLARIPEDAFLDYLKDARREKQEVTTIGLLRVSRPMARISREAISYPVSAKAPKTSIRVFLGDCLDVLPTIPNKSIDFIVADPPYGTTACSWDEVIPFEPLWEELNRVIKKNGVIALFVTEPFSSKLRLSNLEAYKYDLIWDKGKGSNPLLSKKRPMSSHENISIFGGSRYYPQMRKGEPYLGRKTGGNHSNRLIGNGMSLSDFQQEDNPEGLYFPTSVLRYPIHCGSKLHPTEKPVALIEYLIRTYSLEGETVFDFCAGSGTTGIAARSCGRNCVLIEKNKKYYSMIRQRV
jgi:site-specific DNA-methyltransferase (adenine-specific)